MRATIRRLCEADAATFRSLRLEALANHPEAFGASYAVEATLPESEVVARLSRNLVFGAYHGSDLVGMAALAVMEGEKVRHKGYLWGVYVQPVARCSGASQALIRTAVVHAVGLVELILLGVGVNNHPARRLYEREGFEPYGLERHAYKVDGNYVDDLLMVRHSEPAPPGDAGPA